jgi:phosphotransferase system  glucose/maltose/N-acetylglucosamine-specific IIC component
MSQIAIIGLSLLAIFIVGGPIAKAFGSSSPSIGIAVGVIVYFVFTALLGRKN